MARKNRVSIPDGIYHITSRIANKQFLLADDALKEKIVGWMYEVADFSGVDVMSWCVMDNHFHMLVHVPNVPREYWLDQDVEPAAYAQTVRPPVCEYPRWTPATLVSGSSCESEYWEMLAKVQTFRPPIGFALSDDQMRDRLAFLYGSKVASAKLCSWRSMRAAGNGNSVDEEKERYCRRMYNISQFVKTLKERIAMRYNRETGHEGVLWQGRFHSGVVENDVSVKSIVAAYIEYNPCRAGLVASPERWKWSSFGEASTSGRYAERCRSAYERLLGMKWRDVRKLMECIFADKGTVAEQGKERASHAIHREMRVMSRGAYIGRNSSFLDLVLFSVPIRFPRPSGHSLRICSTYEWGTLRYVA